MKCDHCKDRTLEEELALGYIEEIKPGLFQASEKARFVHSIFYQYLTKLK